MRALKILVYGMGVVLIVGVIVLVVTIAYRLKHRSTEAPMATQTVIPPNGKPRPVPLPTGAKIVAAQSDGDRVMVRLDLADGTEELLLLDWKTGNTLATLNLK